MLGSRGMLERRRDRDARLRVVELESALHAIKVTIRLRTLGVDNLGLAPWPDYADADGIVALVHAYTCRYGPKATKTASTAPLGQRRPNSLYDPYVDDPHGAHDEILEDVQ